ncbi:HD-GYP domain-containing protein [Brevibacillus fluminis]|uniref:HD-GYP domain-containing protein n=1 Tax=Brevibacillus fluminis TaxID=511487 RepID=A0A3M8DCG5_9BACL|nr:HD-GYP domain-containing protein [Brevibacillus fluminis]
MRLITLRECQPGAKLARTIYADNGAVLLAQGAVITEAMLERLVRLHIELIYIEDEWTDKLNVDEIVSEETRIKTLAFIERTFRQVAEEPQQWQTLFSEDELGAKLQQVMNEIIGELSQNQAALNLFGTSCAVDHYLFSHSFHVTLYTIAVAWKMGLRDQELVKIGMGAMLHDVGKMMIPASIAQKPGSLTEEEYQIMKQHAKLGYELMKNGDSMMQFAAQCALMHHERLDGSGYPHQKKGDEIHSYVRILTVCDVFDALSSHRVYRQALLPHVAMELLYAGVDKHFDHKVVEAFRNTIALYPLGLSVTLDTGESGVVTGYNQGLPSRPIIRLLHDAEKRVLDHPMEVDLSKQLHLMIAESHPIATVIASPSF